jgi:hypothetical protein
VVWIYDPNENTKVVVIYDGGRVLEASPHLAVTCPREQMGFSSYLHVHSLSARHAPTQVTATDDGGRVLDGSAHLKSRALVSQSDSVARYNLSVSLCVPPDTVCAGDYKNACRWWNLLERTSKKEIFKVNLAETVMLLWITFLEDILCGVRLYCRHFGHPFSVLRQGKKTIQRFLTKITVSFYYR